MEIPAHSSHMSPQPRRNPLARLSSVLATLVILGLSLPEAAFSLGSFVTFESGQVRPLALSPDGTRLFATNTPDNRLEIFAVDGAGIMLHRSLRQALL